MTTCVMQLPLHTAMGLQPFLLLVTASAQPRLCRGAPDHAACVRQTVFMQVRYKPSAGGYYARALYLSCLGALSSGLPMLLAISHGCTTPGNLSHCCGVDHINLCGTATAGRVRCYVKQSTERRQRVRIASRDKHGRTLTGSTASAIPL